MEGCRAIARRAAVPCAALLALAAAGCGGGRPQDADEPSGTYQVDVAARFAVKQQLAAPARFEVSVRNTGRAAVPNVAVSVDSFSTRSEQPGLADPGRAVWIVDREPAGGTTAYVNTWALGQLAPGHVKRFTWRVIAVQPGTHTVKWQVAAGLDGKAKATLAGNRVPAGEFTVDVANRPSRSHVDPATGHVIRER